MDNNSLWLLMIRHNGSMIKFDIFGIDKTNPFGVVKKTKKGNQRVVYFIRPSLFSFDDFWIIGMEFDNFFRHLSIGQPLCMARGSSVGDGALLRDTSAVRRPGTWNSDLPIPKPSHKIYLVGVFTINVLPLSINNQA